MRKHGFFYSAITGREVRGHQGIILIIGQEDRMLRSTDWESTQKKNKEPRAGKILG